MDPRVLGSFHSVQLLYLTTPECDEGEKPPNCLLQNKQLTHKAHPTMTLFLHSAVV